MHLTQRGRPASQSFHREHSAKNQWQVVYRRYRTRVSLPLRLHQWHRGRDKGRFTNKIALHRQRVQIPVIGAIGTLVWSIGCFHQFGIENGVPQLQTGNERTVGEDLAVTENGSVDMSEDVSRKFLQALQMTVNHHDSFRRPETRFIEQGLGFEEGL